MSEEMRFKLEADCNSLNAISTTLRHEGKNKEADCLLTVEAHIFQLIDNVYYVKGDYVNEECINCIYFNPVNKSCIVKNNTDHNGECNDFDNHPYEE